MKNWQEQKQSKQARKDAKRLRDNKKRPQKKGWG